MLFACQIRFSASPLSFCRFKEDYDNFKIEAAKGHGISFFDQATTAVSDLAAWLTGELEYPEEEGYLSEEEFGSKLLKGGKIEGEGEEEGEEEEEEEEAEGSGQVFLPATSTIGGGKGKKGKNY